MFIDPWVFWEHRMMWSPECLRPSLTVHSSGCSPAESNKGRCSLSFYIMSFPVNSSPYTSLHSLIRLYFQWERSFCRSDALPHLSSLPGIKARASIQSLVLQPNCVLKHYIRGSLQGCATSYPPEGPRGLLSSSMLTVRCNTHSFPLAKWRPAQSSLKDLPF